MPLKLVPPRAGKSPYWSVRGTHLGRYVDRSTKARDRKLAQRVLAQWKRDIEQGLFAEPGRAYLCVRGNQLHGSRRRAPPARARYSGTFKVRPLRQIDQAAIDGAAVALFPDATAATRNREVYHADIRGVNTPASI